MSQSIAERHEFILKQLKDQGHVRVEELSQLLNVSTVTIRKDLKHLEEMNLLFRSRGSATLHNPYISDRSVNEKEKMRVGEKRRIAQQAAAMIEAGDTIILASGTTVNEVARQIDRGHPLTVITASIFVAEQLAHRPNIEVLQLGGILRNNSSSVVGPYAEQMLASFTCSKLFLGVDGIDLDFGLTTTNALEANLNKAMLRAAQRVIVVADATKFDRRGFSKICHLDEVDEIITDRDVPPSTVANLEEMGILVRIA
jgi:DeoR family transcriptional regulator of aga operon